MPNLTREQIKERLRIDRNNLDGEWVEQPQLFHDVCEGAAYAMSRRDQLKNEVKQVDAKLSNRLRKKLAEEGKVTKDLLAQRVEAHDEHVEAVKAFSTAAFEVDQWAALKEAFGQRLKALEYLVDLFKAGYFQAGSSKAGQANEVQYDQRREKMREARRRL